MAAHKTKHTLRESSHELFHSQFGCRCFRSAARPPPATTEIEDYWEDAQQYWPHTQKNASSPPGTVRTARGQRATKFDTLVGEVFRSKMDSESGEGDGDVISMNMVRKERDLTIEEKRFLLAVEHGDMPKVKQFLQDSLTSYHININCVDPLGRSALLIAIENENMEMLELLLHHNVELGDALLHAISEENVEAVEMILNYEEEKRRDLKGSQTTLKNFLLRPSESLGSLSQEFHPQSTERESAFTADITPIILAAHRDNYEIIKILLDRGADIPMPHDVRCACNDCSEKNSSDSLRHSRSRLNAYRALSSPCLIALSSKDPILTAFELSWELKYLSRIENEFKSEYEELAKKCQDFATALLDQTRSSQELAVILNHDSGHSLFDSGSKDSSDRMALSRLKLAIKYKQKKFVSHPNCQQLLASIWYEGLPGFRRRNILFKFFMIMSIGICFPVFSTMYLMAPKSSLGMTLRKPFIKFICHSASYFTFLFFLILASQRIESIISVGGDDDELGPTYKNERRGSPATSIEWMILAWVAGLVWSEIKQLWDEGLYDYSHDMWNILDFITNALYLATIALRVCAYVIVENEKVSNKIEQAMAPRKDWDAYDPTLISEGLFAAANIFSSLKLVYIFTVNPYLGPLQISLGRMVIDIMKFAFILALVVFAFACGLTQLYWYYATMRAQECQSFGGIGHVSCEKKYKSFLNLFESLQTLYWGLYGLVDLTTFKLQEDHEYTEFVGLLMFGVYSAISIVVLLNMLIAMMSNSYQIIANQADTEWKFARSKLWMSYFEDGGTMPPPFNIIPSPKSFYYLIKWMYQKLCSCSNKQKRTRWKSLKKIVRKVSERDARYQAVMRSLVKRYVTNMQRQQQHQGVNEDDINEIKQDISSFRYELLEILKYSGISGPPDSTRKASSKNKKNRLQERRLMKGLNLERTIDPIPETDFGLGMPIQDLLKEDDDIVKNKPSPRKTSHFGKLPFKKKPSAAQQWEHLLSNVRELAHLERDKKHNQQQQRQLGDVHNDSFCSQLSESDSNRGSERLPSLSPHDTDSASSVHLDVPPPPRVGCEVSLDGARIRRTVSNPPEITSNDPLRLNTAPLAVPEKSDSSEQKTLNKEEGYPQMIPSTNLTKKVSWRMGDEDNDNSSNLHFLKQRVYGSNGEDAKS